MHFRGWAKRHDEWIACSADRLRNTENDISDDEDLDLTHDWGDTTGRLDDGTWVANGRR